MTIGELVEALSPAARALLVRMVEAVKTHPDGGRRFLISRSMSPTTHVSHMSRRWNESVPNHQVDELKDMRAIQRASRDVWTLSPQAEQIYRVIKGRVTEPIDRIQHDRQSALETATFVRRYPQTAELLRAATGLLEADDAAANATQIGHAVREAMQTFVSELASNLRMDLKEPDPAKTVARLRQLLDATQHRHGSDTVDAYLKATVAYWGCVSDLAQRQEHGGAREGDGLTWEDSRRTLYTAQALMFEMDRALVSR